MISFPLATVQIYDDDDAKELIALLEATVPLLMAFELEPTLVAEAPHKFNDGWYDDFWCAVQAGATFWEQSQFFENASNPRSTERASFTLEEDAASIEGRGAMLHSRRIDNLRTALRGLQTAGWRDAVERSFQPPRNLIALIYEFGQPWLYLEEVNGDDGDAFAWDDNGFFHVGVMSRLDQAVARPQILQFEKVDPENLHRLSARAQKYFLPKIGDSPAAQRLAALLNQAAATVRGATDVPVALRASSSRLSAGDQNLHPSYNRPESFATNLRSGEGAYRLQKDGAWPPYYSGNWRLRKQSDLSDAAKAYHTALFHLEEGDWREEFGKVLGEELNRGETLALFIAPDDAILMLDNMAFRVVSDGLEPLGTLDYVDCNNPALTLQKAQAINGS